MYLQAKQNADMRIKLSAITGEVYIYFSNKFYYIAIMNWSYDAHYEMHA